MTSSEIRQSFLDFFREKQHTIVPSSSLMPDSPNLLFTNAGMNQFVPIFLGEKRCPYSPGRAADTQKCIRAGGKHNDLDDVGLDTYHHTFFEMLGNWSFGDYFKKEAIDWAWSLVIGHWKFPANRLYATVYSPDKSLGDPSDFDQEAHDFWAEKFRAAGLDPAVHIVNGNKKDNFWMMGDTGPCGPCSELHVDLTPLGDTRGTLVNKGDARCIEIWNLVFIQFCANSDGTFAPLPARHVDTGMGFERVASIIQGTKNFTDFASAKISNYETDIFRPIFDELERMSGKTYGSTLPQASPVSNSSSSLSARPSSGLTHAADLSDRPSSVSNRPASSVGGPGKGGGDPIQHVGQPSEHAETPIEAVGQQGVAVGASIADQIATDIAFRVIGDHIRTLSFAIADGIQPGNTDRNYVLRRILRRAVRYGRTLGFHEPFFYKLVDVLARTMGDVFPEIRAKQAQVKDVLKREEEAFNRTLDSGILVFEVIVKFNTTASALLEFSNNSIAKIENELPTVKYLDTSTSHPMLAAVADEIDAAASRFREVFSKFAQKVGRTEEPVAWLDSLNKLHDGLRDLLTPRWSEDQFQALHKGVKDHISVFRSEGANPYRIEISGKNAFLLYDTYGFPLDLTELMARERGLTVDVAGFEKLMDEQRARARAAQKKEVISVSDDNLQLEPTKFLGYDFLETEAVVEAVTPGKHEGEINVVLDRTACYAEMGGQVGDHGLLHLGEVSWPILDTQKKGDVFVHRLGSARASRAGFGASPKQSSGGATPEKVRESEALSPAREGACATQSDARALTGEIFPEPGELVRVSIDTGRRAAIQRHHTVTHLLHWALHEVVSRDATQKGSFVGADKLTFDFNSAALTLAQVADVEKLVNEKIVENAGVSWTEVPYAEVKKHPAITQFFGDKYGDVVRVVQIGGQPRAFDGYSMELCGGTHTRATGEIGLFRIVSEAAIAAGVRRIEAVAGLNAYDFARADSERLKTLASKLNAPLGEIEKKLDALLAQQKDLEKSLKSAQQREAAGRAKDLLASAETINGTPAIIEKINGASGDELQTIADALKSHGFKGVIVLAGDANDAVALVASVSSDFTAKIQAGKIIQTIAPIVGGKGGGKPDNARGGGKDASKLDEALAKAKSLL